ncbi:hypothetical protein [Halorubellus salinus]|uniref:hypothetical protein n=1 Tax=Halorubellus salinus TaxID=755309 RepID=UPI001D0859B3|nr:hypothetical protein [Halorubellus salinus]
MTGVDESRRERVVGAFLVAFAGCVTAPLPVVLGGAGERGVLAGSVGVAVGVGLVVAAGVRQSDALLGALAAPRWLLLPGGAVVAWTVGAFLQGPPLRATVLAPYGVAFAGCVLGVAAWVLARDVHDRRRRETATTAVSFEAPIAPRSRRAMRLGGAVTVVGGVVAAVGLGVGDDPMLAFAYLPLAAAGVVFLAFSRTEREVRVADEALFVNRSKRSWREFESVRVEDDVLVVDGRGRWRGALRFDATAIEDLDGVVVAIRERVDELAIE